MPGQDTPGLPRSIRTVICLGRRLFQPSGAAAAMLFDDARSLLQELGFSVRVQEHDEPTISDGASLVLGSRPSHLALARQAGVPFLGAGWTEDNAIDLFLAGAEIAPRPSDLAYALLPLESIPPDWPPSTLGAVPRARSHACRVCGNVTPGGVADPLCLDCRAFEEKGWTELSRVHYAWTFAYRDRLSRTLRTYKGVQTGTPQRELAFELGRVFMAESLRSFLGARGLVPTDLARPGAPLFVPVPTSTPLAFHPAAELLEIAAREMNAAPQIRFVLHKTGSSVKHLPYRNRPEAVAGTIRLEPDAHIEARDVVLLDDIFASGATCREAARVLRRAGAGRIEALVLARTPYESPAR